MADDQIFHFKEDFFEEILNGVPQKDISIDYEKNTKVNLNPNSSYRVKHVAKAFLSSEESRNVFSSLIKEAKKKQSKNLLGKLNIKLFEEDVEDDIKDDEEEEIENIAEGSKKSGPVDKIMALKKKFEKLKEIGKKGNKVLYHIRAIKSYFAVLGMTSFSSAVANRNKIIRDMNENVDKVMDDQINPILDDAIIPSLTTTLFSMTGKTKGFIDDILEKYYKFLDVILGLIIEKEVTKALSYVPYLGPVLKIYEKGKSLYKKGRRLYRKSKGVRAMEDVAEEIIENPEMAREVLKGGVTGFFALFGHIDENGQKKIDLGIKAMIKTSKDKGNEIIQNLSNNSSDKNLIAETGDLFATGKNVLGEFKTIADNKINEMIYAFDEKTPKHQKYEYVYNILRTSYFKELEYSPWSKCAMNLNNMVLFVQKRFDDMFDRFQNKISAYAGFVNKKNQVLTIQDLGKYIKKFNSKGARIIIEKGGKEISLKRVKKTFNHVNDDYSLFIKAKTYSNFSRKDGKYNIEFEPCVRIHVPLSLKLKYHDKKYDKINFPVKYFKREYDEKGNMITKELKKREIYFQMSKIYSPKTIKKIECDTAIITNPKFFIKEINKKYYTIRGKVLNKLFSPFTFYRIDNKFIENDYWNVKVSKNDAKLVDDGVMLFDKNFDGINYDDKKYTRYTQNYDVDISVTTKYNDIYDKDSFDYLDNPFFRNDAIIHRSSIDSFKEEKIEIKRTQTELKWMNIVSTESLIENYSLRRYKNINKYLTAMVEENERFKRNLIKLEKGTPQ